MDHVWVGGVCGSCRVGWGGHVGAGWGEPYRGGVGHKGVGWVI